MRIKEVRGLMKMQLIPTSSEKAMALLGDEELACKN
jgi:hypothetical protein